MPAERGIHEEVTFTVNLQSLVATYEEIAVMRIEHVRKEVLKARVFREQLAEVFAKVRATHQQEIAQTLAKQNKQKGRANQEAWVLLSTNSHLAGSVTGAVTRSFVTDLQKETPAPDVIIVGSVGRERFISMLPDHPYKYFDVPEGSVGFEALQPLVSHLLQYEFLNIFFARFQNLINQEPTRVDLGKKDLLDKPVEPTKALWFTIPTSNYLFEPSLEEVVKFFQDEVLAVLIRQTWDEAWLSLLGSRITAMEQASSNITDELKKLEWLERRADRHVRNRKQRDRLAGMTLWHNR